jgi:hypothetical protein
LQRIANEVWGSLDGTSVTERSFGRGRVFWGQSVQAVLDKLDLKPDFEFTSRSGNAEMNYIHRTVGEAEVYFIANNRYQSEDLVCTFRIDDKQPEFWKADTGEMIPASIYSIADGRTNVPIQLDPAGSVFVVFRSEAPASRTISVGRGGTTLASTEPLPVVQPAAVEAEPATRRGGGGFGGFGSRGGSDIPTILEELPVLSLATTSNGRAGLLFRQNGTYSLRNNSGQTSSIRMSGIGAAMEITGPWRLSFPPKLGAPSEVTLDKLVSWTEHSNDGVKYFSGTATYSKQVNIAAIDTCISNLHSDSIMGNSVA